MTTIRNNMVVSDIKLNNKTVVITGANTGIGYETALDLAGRGARVIMACRDTAKAEEAKSKILEKFKTADVVVKELDLASFDSIRKCAKEINETEERLDILINNAGISMCPYWKTKEGFEMQLGVNHIGHFLFTKLLLDIIKRSTPSRILIVASFAHVFAKMNWYDLMSEKYYDSVGAYSQSKLANMLFGAELSRRLEEPLTAALEMTNQMTAASSASHLICHHNGWITMLREFVQLIPQYTFSKNKKDPGLRSSTCRDLSECLINTPPTFPTHSTGVKVYIVHPGYVRTDLLRYVEKDNSDVPLKWKMISGFFGIFIKPVATYKGAQTSIYCAIAPEIQETSGKYYSHCKEKTPAAVARKPEDARRLWELTEEWIKAKPQGETS